MAPTRHTHAPVRVLCIDDNEFVIEAMERKLSREPDLAFAGSALSADALLEEVDAAAADLVLIDMNMPGRDPVDAVRDLALTRPGVRSVALSGYVREDIIDRFLAAGGYGYVAKDEDLDTIMHALRQAAAGEIVFSPIVLRHYADSASSHGPRGFD